MWDRSDRWQRQVRLAAGVLAVLSLIVAGVGVANTSAARRTRAGAGDLVSELVAPNRLIIEVAVPSELGTQVGTLVYREREDGIAQVIGRVVAVDADGEGQVKLAIRLSATSDKQQHHGGVLKGAPATLGLAEAVQLLVTPGTPSEEAKLARDVIWPSIQSNVLPEIMEGLIREVSAELTDPDPEDAELLKQFVERLHGAIEPLENELVERLARRAWETVGVQGLASGVLRAKADDAKAVGMTVANWWSWLNGSEPKTPAADRPFLSEETSQALKKALEEEVVSFWTEHRAQLGDAFKKVVDERRQDFETALKRWSVAFYERVIVPTWQAGQAKVTESVEDYVSDFAKRRLLTSQGGPRLRFAYILRSYLDISAAPLLILAPAADGQSSPVVYEPLLK